MLRYQRSSTQPGKELPWFTQSSCSNHSRRLRLKDSNQHELSSCSSASVMTRVPVKSRDDHYGKSFLSDSEEKIDLNLSSLTHNFEELNLPFGKKSSPDFKITK